MPVRKNFTTEEAKEIGEIRGVVVICGELMGAYGDVELIKIKPFSTKCINIC